MRKILIAMTTRFESEPDVLAVRLGRSAYVEIRNPPAVLGSSFVEWIAQMMSAYRSVTSA